MRVAVGLVLVALAVSGCGGGGEEPSATETSVESSATPSSTETPLSRAELALTTSACQRWRELKEQPQEIVDLFSRGETTTTLVAESAFIEVADQMDELAEGVENEAGAAIATNAAAVRQVGRKLQAWRPGEVLELGYEFEAYNTSVIDVTQSCNRLT